MHHPGPPRFTTAGADVELAPRDPDPEATYRWTLQDSPPDAEATVGDDPVEHFEPDVPGRYRLTLEAPDGTHDLTVLALDESLRPGDVDGVPAGYSRDGDDDEDTVTGGTRPEGDGVTTSGWRSVDSTRDAGTRPRLRLDATVDDDAVVVTPRVTPAAGSEETDAPSVEFLIDDRDDLRRETVEPTGDAFRLPRSALPERTRLYAVAIGTDAYSVPDAIDLRRSEEDVIVDGGGSVSVTEADGAGDDPVSDSGLASNSPSAVEIHRPYDPPAWAEDAVIYEIYVRTFQGDQEGSALEAIADRLDHMAELGVDVLWLTPVLENDHAPHGYNITDFFAIAEDIGTQADYEALIDAAHERGMKVLFDLVCNHSARDHPYFQEAVTDPESPYRDWYEWRDADAGEPETYFEWEYIANFDFDTLAVRRHLLDAVEQWAPLVDGFRCDMAWAVPDAFWMELHDHLKATDPEFLLLDETIPYIPDYQAGLFDVHFDSTTYFALRQIGRGEQPAHTVIDAIEERADAGFPDHAAFMLYAENHDEGRYVTECGKPASKAAAGAIFTLPGAAMIYAGQELGQRGRRDDLAWADAQTDLLEHVQRLVDARQTEPALTHRADLGRIDYHVADGNPEAVVAYARTPSDPSTEGSRTTDDALIVVLNFAGEPATVRLEPPVDSTDVLTGTDVSTTEGFRVENVVALRAN